MVWTAYIGRSEALQGEKTKEIKKTLGTEQSLRAMICFYQFISNILHMCAPAARGSLGEVERKRDSR
jgi:hypothetical protein